MTMTNCNAELVASGVYSAGCVNGNVLQEYVCVRFALLTSRFWNSIAMWDVIYVAYKVLEKYMHTNYHVKWT